MLQLKYQEDGLIPAIIQDRHSGKVLMLGYMNADAYQKTLIPGFVTFYSRSRQKLWTKGETSGHRLMAREIRVDCDQDALLIQADLTGPGLLPHGLSLVLLPQGDPQWRGNHPRARIRSCPRLW